MDPKFDVDAPPPIPAGPPWPADFVAALHAGCYDDEDCVDPEDDPVVALWARVREDPVASVLLDDLDRVQAVLGRLGGLKPAHTGNVRSERPQGVATPGRSRPACDGVPPATPPRRPPPTRTRW